MAIAINNNPAPSTGAGTATALGMTNSYVTNTSGAAGSVNTDDIILTAGASTGADDVTYLGAAYNNTSGNVRLDNVLISGTAVSSVPVPGAVWLFGSALAGFVGFKRRKAA